MNPAVVLCISLALIASVNGGSQRFGRQGWGAPPPPPLATSIAEIGVSEAAGAGGSVAEHANSVSIAGSNEVPAIASLGAGSYTGLDQYASNYQQSQINSDGSSSAYQGNSASNSGYANEYLSGLAQGLNVNINSAGWSATEGEGWVAQQDDLAHNAGSPGSGWKQ